jgi:potassium-dependent mechanosensitive channel
MDQGVTNTFLKPTLLFIALTLIFVLGTQAQDKDTQVTDSTQVVNKAISIDDIPEKTENLAQRITKFREVLKPSAEITEVDSLLNSVAAEINTMKDSLSSELANMTRRELKVRKVEWINYRSRLQGYQDVLKSRTEEVSKINDEITLELQKWELTKTKLVSDGTSIDVYGGLDEVIAILQDVLKTVHNRLEGIFIIQKGLTGLILTVNETLAEIDLIVLQMQKNYFAFDSEPIWMSKKIGKSAIDTITVVSVTNSKLISSGLKENKAQLKEFIGLNFNTFVIQIAFILLLLLLMIRVKSKWKQDVNELTNPVEIQAEIVLSHPISSSIVAGVLISAFFYDVLIPAVIELHTIIIFIGMIFLLPKLTTNRFRIFLALILFVYFIQIFLAYVGPEATVVRWLLMVNAIILIAAFVVGRKIMNQSPIRFKPVYRIFKVVAPFYITFLLLSIITNMIGMVGLSNLLLFGVLISTVLGLVVHLTVKVIVSLVLIIFKLRKSSSIEALSTMINATHQRIQPILNWTGLIVWIIFTLKGFDLFDFFKSWVNKIMILHWKVGEMTISLEGVLAFFGIFILFIILAKQAASIFKDEWMINVLPRGAAPAISLLLRITLIGAGLYIALSTAGLDLSKLGFILGALGVGIGFGLQNVVLNFISGLILAFERPINIGDTIEVEQEMGVVTDIGVRSSHIRSYSGYESIIPNGDLISKKVINYTLSNRDRRSKILMKTAPNADPEKVIELLNRIASDHPNTYSDPAPITYFYGYDPDGNLSFALLYWLTFSDTLETDSAIALDIFSALKKAGIQAPAPVRRIVDGK